MIRKILFIFILFLLVFSSCKKEEGCMDPIAINYNPDAEKDDGSCIYETFPPVVGTIINYTTNDGLLSNFVECIDVDENNNVWFGTSNGVQKYDGNEWISYTSNNHNGIPSDNIKVIKVMNNGDVWIGTDFGASKFDGSNWMLYDFNSGLISSQIQSIDEDLDGNVWIGTNMGVSYFDGLNWQSYGSSDLHWSGVNDIAFDSQGAKWFTSPLGGITHFYDNIFVNYDVQDGLLSENTTSIIIDDNNNKWIGTGSGVSVLDATNNISSNYTRMYLLSPPDTLNPVVDLDIDQWNRPWVAIYVGYLAQGGIAYFENNQWIDLDINDGIAGTNVKGVAIHENNVWIATTTGVSKIILE